MSIFCLIAKNEPTVPHNQLTPTAVRSICIETQAQQYSENNIIVIGPITVDNCNAVRDIAKEIGVTLTDTSFKIRRFGKDNKHVVCAIHELKLTKPFFRLFIFSISIFVILSLLP